jgi:MoxR-like ATPase
LKSIVDVHHPDIKTELVRNALEIFFEIRQVNGLKKRPSTSELIDWLKLLVSDELSVDQLQDNDIKQALPPLFGALIKNEQDVHLLERLAFMSRRKEL